MIQAIRSYAKKRTRGYHLVGRINAPTFLLRDDTPTSCRCARTPAWRYTHSNEKAERERDGEKERVNAPSSWINEADYSARFSRRHGPDRVLEPLRLIFSGPTSTGGELNRDELKTVQLRGQGRVNFQVQGSSRLSCSQR